MTRQTHDMVEDHFGVLDDTQIADGTPTTGDVPVSNGDGTRTWGSTGGGGGSGGATELVTGDDSTFATSLGSWTASAGSITRDTGYKMANGTASLKHTGGSSGVHVDLAITGTFKADQTYQCVVWWSSEATSGTANTTLTFGDIGASDTTAITFIVNTGSNSLFVGDSNFIALGLTWKPTADRTSVSFRQTMTSGAGPYHIGMLRVWQAPSLGPMTVYTHTYYPSTASSGDVAVLSPYRNSASTGFYMQANSASTNMVSPGGTSAAQASTDYMYIYAESPASDFSYSGIELDTGDDFLALYLTEKDSSTYQMYGYDDQNFEMADLGTGTWQHRAEDDGIAIPSKGQLPIYSAAPGSPYEGQSYYDSTLHKSRTWDGSTWNNHW